MLHAIIKTVTYCAALNWFRAPKCFNFCLSQRMQERIDPNVLITYIGSIFHGPSGPGPRFFIVGHGHFQHGMASMQNWHFLRSEEVSIQCHISAICGSSTTDTLIQEHSIHCIDAACSNQNGHIITMAGPRAVILVCSTHICMVQCTHLITKGGTPHLYNGGSSMLVNSLHSRENNT